MNFCRLNARNDFHGGQPFAGMSDVRTQPLNVISEHLAAFASARDADVKLLLMDGGQRTRRRHDQHFIHGLALGGVRRDGVAVSERAVVFRNHPAIGQHNGIALNRLHLDEFAIDEPLAGSVRLQQQLVAGGDFQLPFLPHIKRGEASHPMGKDFQNRPHVEL